MYSDFLETFVYYITRMNIEKDDKLNIILFNMIMKITIIL